MVKHIFLTCGVLLSATAQTAFAKELEGMLVTQNNYVRIRSCDLKNNYTLLPGSGNGYEAAAEIISVRKNTPENTPIYVGLIGNLENTNFLISGIDFIKMGESCHVPHTETPPAEVVIRKYPLNQQKSGSTGRKPESKQDKFYYHEIIGLEVYENDVLLGTIKEILQPGANDVWVVKRKGKRDLLLPYIPPVVLGINIEQGRVDVEIPEGLDDEN